MDTKDREILRLREQHLQQSAATQINEIATNATVGGRDGGDGGNNVSLDGPSRDTTDITNLTAVLRQSDSPLFLTIRTPNEFKTVSQLVLLR